MMMIEDGVRRLVTDGLPAVVASALERAGGEVYVVGGAVRDVALGFVPNDVDLLVRLVSHETVDAVLSGLDGAVAYTGEDFGVFRFRNRTGAVEVALPRSDHSTGLGHRAFEVQEDPELPIVKDLARRDFTVNAMAVPLRDGHLIDPFDGRGDAWKRRLRILTARSMFDDPLRTIRGLVLNARFGLVPDPSTLRFMMQAAGRIVDLPHERLQAELDKLLAAADPASGVRLARRAGILRFFLMEVDAAFGFDQNNPHHELDLGEHLVSVLERITALTDDPDVRLAALLHDVGKPSSAWVDPVTGSSHYYEGRGSDGERLGADHERVGGSLVFERLGTLRWPARRRNRVTALVVRHMFAEFTTRTGARRFLSANGDLSDALLVLRRADQGAGKREISGDVDRMERLVVEVRAEGDAVGRADLAVSGRDVVAAGVPVGPRVGEILSALVEMVVVDPSRNERGILMDEIVARVGTGMSTFAMDLAERVICGAQDRAHDDGGLVIYGTCQLKPGHGRWYQEWRDERLWAEWSGPVKQAPIVG
jgi:tRNA nucleotidyltransferase (CCA-adding enzyme)